MLYLLDRDVRTVRWNGLPLHEASSAIVQEKLNGDHFLVVKYPISDSGVYRELREDLLIKAPVPVLGPQLFRIKKPVEYDDHVELTAYHVTDDIMQRSVEPMGVNQTGCAMALSQLVQKVKTTLGDFSLTSDIFDRHTFNTKETATLYSVLMDGKHSIVGTWEGELVRDNFALSVKKARGADRGVIITTHNNLESYQRTRNSQGVVTRIHVKSTFRPEGVEVDTVLQVTVDSPLINQYPYINEKEYENNEAKTVEELRKWAEAKFANEKIDQVTDAIEIEAYELDGQIVHLGDMVTIKSRKHGADLTKKAIAYEFDCLANGGKGAYLSLTFDDKSGAGGSGVSSGVSAAAGAILGVTKTAEDRAIDKAIANANAAFDAEFDKAKQAIEDGIEQAKAAGEQYAAEIAAKVAEVEAEADLLIQQARENDRKADEALERAGAVHDLAKEAKTISQAAAEAAEEKARELTQQLQATNRELEAAKQDLTDQARDLLTQAQAQTDLTRKVQTVEETANGTRSTVTELTKTVNAATGDLQSVTQRVASTEVGLTSVRDQYSQLSQTVSGQTGQLTAINRQTADLQRGLNGVTERFEKSRVGMKNLVANSKINESSNAYGFATRQVKLEAGKTYWFGARAKKVGGTADKEAKVWLIAPGWADSASLSFTSTSHETKFRKHVAKATATYDIRTYWFPNGGDRSGTADIDWYMVVESDLQPTDWVASDEDIRQELADYKRTATENTSRLEQAIRTADGKAESAKTLAQQTAQGLELKAEKTSLDGLTGRMSSAEGSLSLHADQIAQRLTATQVDTAITAKGYQTKSQVDANITGRGYITNAALAGYVPTTTFDNYKRETAQSIEQKLTATKVDILGLTPRLTDFNSVKQTAQLYERIIGSSENDIARNMSRMVMASDVMQTEIRKIPTKTSSVNLVPNSKINESSNAYGFATRQVKLEAGKTYWFGARARKAGGTANREVKVWLIAPGWSESHALSFTGTDYETKFLKFVPRTSAVFDIRTYWFPNGGDRSGTADIDWYMVAESDTQPTSWSQASEDTEVLGTRVTQLADSWAVKTLSGNGDVLSAINLATGGASIQVGENKLVVAPETTYIKNGTIKSAHIEELHGGKITAGSIEGKHLKADAIEAKYIKVDGALIEKLFVVKGEAIIDKLTSQSAFIVALETIDLSATQIKSGILKATNGAMSVNLDTANITFNQNATINFNSGNNSLVRKKGTHTAFLHFADVASTVDGGAGSIYASIGVTSSGDGVNSASSGRFSGLRIFRGAKGTNHLATIDQSELYGDLILLKDDFVKNRGFQFNPSTIDKMVDMNYLVNAVRALGRCWTHWNNTGWNTSDQNLRNSVMQEYNSYIRNL